MQYSFAINKYKNPSLEIIKDVKPTKLTDATPKAPEATTYQSKDIQDPKKTINFNSFNNYSNSLGLFLGYNHAINEHLIVGAELDTFFSLSTDSKMKQNKVSQNVSPTEEEEYNEIPFNATNSLDATLRARAGVNLGDFLPYIAGGINVKYSLAHNDALMKLAKDDLERVKLPKDAFHIKIDGNNNLHFGWTLGAGFEYKLHKNVSVRAEYRYNNALSSKNEKIITTTNNKTKGIQVTEIKLDGLSSHDVRFSVSYYF